jgi:hypothetical protein
MMTAVIDPKPPTCKRCGRPFTPRFGSGGSLRRFCCTACRLDFHKERQRSERRGVYAGPTTRRARGEPAKTETLPRASAVAALGPWETGVLNIAGCERTEFVVALNKDESAGTRAETWPPEVQTFIDQHVTRWVVQNKDKHTVRAMTVAAPKRDGIQCCVVILHHSPQHDVAAGSSEHAFLDGALPRPEASHD